MPADSVVLEELGIDLQALTYDRRPFGRLVHFDQDQRGGLAGIDDDELVGVHACADIGYEPFSPPELDEPRIVAHEGGDKLHAVERMAGGHETGRSVCVEGNSAASGWAESVRDGDSATFSWQGLSSYQAIEPKLAGASERRANGWIDEVG